MRFTYIDGLRGLAAAAVMLHHFVEHRVFDGAFPWLRDVCHFGHLGVPMFFCISGFVIAHSVAEKSITAKFYGNFVLRRVIRLDPPYWFAIALCIATTALGNKVFPSQAKPLPSEVNVVAHLFYVYPFFGYEPIEAVFWTLVHEVQFYLTYVALMAFMQRVTGSLTPTPAATALLIGLPAVVSAAGLFHVRGTITVTWDMFALGVFAYYLHRRWISWKLFAGLLLAIAATLGTGNVEFKVAAIATSTSFVVAGGRYFSTWLSGRLFQFLGAISYSLYLVHGIVGWRVLSVADAKFAELNPWMILSAAISASIVAAWLMRRCIEVPSIAVASRFKPAKA